VQQLADLISQIPFNRFVAFAKPYINLGAGAIAGYLVGPANVLGIHGIDQDQLAKGLATAGVWLATTGLTQLGDLKWLKGHHIQIAGDAQVQAAALAAAVPAPTTPVAAGAPEGLPSDAEELAAPDHVPPAVAAALANPALDDPGPAAPASTGPLTHTNLGDGSPPLPPPVAAFNPPVV
jgi:hypothetical protein